MLLLYYMSELISALDMKNSIQYGEKNHIEYTWSQIQQEKILQISFQLVRCNNEDSRARIAKRFCECFENGNINEKKVLIKMLGQTRDIEEGKGEYALSFSVLKELMKIDTNLCVEMMKYFVGYEKEDIRFGSWKDMKYLFNELQYCPIEMVQIINSQLVKDMSLMKQNKSCSLLCKWIPREGSKKFGWIHKRLAKDFYKVYEKYGWSDKATSKAQTLYRKMVSKLNKYVDTIQIKQCSKMWRTIDFNKVTSVTMIKQKNAFLKGGDQDREVCKNNLLNYMEEVKSGVKTMKGKNVGMIDYVKQAIYCNDDDDRDIINESWKDNSKYTGVLKNMIAMVDTSGSMECDNAHPLYSALGLGCRVAEKSSLGRRVMTFNSKPEWINLDDEKDDFCGIVKKMRNMPWGMNTNFYSAMNMILDGIVETKMSASDVNELTLCVFSDMQFDGGSTHGYGSVRENLEQKYHEAGVKICGVGYKVPHIIFWNLRNTDGFPVLSYHEGYSMMSGNSPQLLNTFTDDGIGSLEQFTPWNVLVESLNKKRYVILEELIK